MGFILKISLCKYIYSSVCSTNMSHHIQNWENQGGGSRQGQTREGGNMQGSILGGPGCSALGQGAQGKLEVY